MTHTYIYVFTERQTDRQTEKVLESVKRKAFPYFHPTQTSTAAAVDASAGDLDFLKGESLFHSYFYQAASLLTLLLFQEFPSNNLLDVIHTRRNANFFFLGVKSVLLKFSLPNRCVGKGKRGGRWKKRKEKEREREREREKMKKRKRKEKKRKGRKNLSTTIEERVDKDLNKTRHKIRCVCASVCVCVCVCHLFF